MELDFLKLEKSKGGLENVLVVTDHFAKLRKHIRLQIRWPKQLSRLCLKSFCPLSIPEEDQSKLTGADKSPIMPITAQSLIPLVLSHIV